ncbi:TadE/TadG family type IV pilus assembly protein [Chelativorans sp. Marseille-P2723]|uniref:TadE/TadG family type IV pilus assembly protein n=1 Tax=Chelativorans sp. Marseille-P2723 TaxID=2709133 RepID=UPI00156E240F|nr:TadE/TadG family type IV pilus assembly protein [Chelativorans sp. Marseille-P2723]
MHSSVLFKYYRRMCCRSGAAALEFAIIAPIFLFLFMGMVAYGIYFAAMHSLQQLSADAARISIAGVDSQERLMLVERFLETHASGYIFVDPVKLDAEISDSPEGDQFTVALNYDAGHLPIWGLFNDLPLPGKVISRSATIRIGGL